MDTKTAMWFLALGIAMIVSVLGSVWVYESVTKVDFPHQLSFFNGLLVTIGVVSFYSGVRNVWVNAKRNNSGI